MSEWESFSKAEGARLTLATYVTQEAVTLFRLGINRTDELAHTRDRRRIVEAVYEALVQASLNYANPLHHDDQTGQPIRTPAEISGEAAGTCLDLAVLFCGVCLGNDLLPYLVVLDGHALAAVSLRWGRDQHTTAEAGRRRERESFSGGLLTDEDAARSLLVSEDFVLVECTGVARTERALSPNFPEGRGRVDGRLTFDEAVRAGREQLVDRHQAFRAARPFGYVLDVAAAQSEWGMRAQRFQLAAVPVEAISAIVVGTADDLGERKAMIGRTEFVGRIRERLERGERVLIQGFAGLGKTAVARALVAGWVEADAGRTALWIRVGRADADAVFEAVGREIGAPEIMAARGKARVTAFRNALRRTPRLLVLDDVWQGRTVDAVRDGMPDNCTILVTSRDRHLGMDIESLPRLDPEQSLELLGHYARADYDDDRAAADLVELLGGHPFALEIAGLTLYLDDMFPDRLLAHIRDAPHRLVMPGDPEEGRESVQALLDASVELLDPAEREVFLAFGAAFVAGATSAILAEYLAVAPSGGISKAGHRPAVDDVETALRYLRRRGLAELGRRPGGQPDRYVIHDLAYSYVRAQTTDADRFRMLDAVRDFVARHQEPTPENVVLLGSEVQQACAAASWALGHERDADVVALAESLYFERVMERLGMHEAAVDLQNGAVEASRRLGQRWAEARAISDLAKAQARIGRFDDAEANFRRALSFYQRADDLDGEANEQGNLGALLVLRDRFTEAMPLLEVNLQLRRSNEDTDGEGRDLGNLGVAYRRLGRLDDAVGCYRRRIELDETRRDYYALVGAYGNLGNVYLELRQPDNALDSYTRALDMARKAGYVVGEAHVLVLIGGAHRARGDLTEAARWYRQAVEVAQQQDYVACSLEALNALASALIDLGNDNAAVGQFEAALRLTNRIEDPRPRIEQLIQLGSALVRVDRLSEAEQRLTAAQELAAERADPLLKGNVQAQRAWVARKQPARRAEAASLFEQAIDCARKADAALQECIWLTELAGWLAEDGDHDEALARIASAGAAAGDDHGSLARVAAAHGYVLQRAERFREAATQFREAVRLTRGVDNQWLLPDYLGELGNCAQSAGNLEDAQRYFREAADAATERRNHVAEAQWRSALAGVLAGNGRRRAAATELGRADELQPAADRDTVLSQLHLGAECRRALGQPAAAQELLERARQLADAGQDPISRATVANALVELHLESTDMEAAAAAMARLEQLEPLLPARESLRLVEGARLVSDYYRGSIAAAIARQKAITADAESCGDPPDLTWQLGTLSLLYCAAGRVDLAHACQDRVEEAAAVLPPVAFARSLLTGVDVRTRLDDLTGAAATLSRVTDVVEGMDDLIVLGDLAAANALLDLLDGNYRLAAVQAGSAMDRSLPRARPLRCATLGLALLLGGDRQRAQSAVGRALGEARVLLDRDPGWCGAAYGQALALACQVALDGSGAGDQSFGAVQAAYRRALSLCDAPGIVADARRSVAVLSRDPTAEEVASAARSELASES